MKQFFRYQHFMMCVVFTADVFINIPTQRKAFICSGQQSHRVRREVNKHDYTLGMLLMFDPKSEQIRDLVY